MSTLTATTSNATARTARLPRLPLLLRRLHSLTGIMFGLYVLLHLSINATLIEGARYTGQPTIYQQQVDKIHALPFLKAVSLALLIVPLIYHSIWGVYVMVNGRPNVGDYGYGRNWLYLWQRITALVLILFIAFHVMAFKGVFNGVLGPEMHFVPAAATESTILHFRQHWWIGWIVYPIGVLAATFHTANGFWAAGVSWGLTVSKAAMRRWAVFCGLLFVGLTAAGFTAIVAVMTHDRPLPIDPALPRVQVSVTHNLG